MGQCYTKKSDKNTIINDDNMFCSICLDQITKLDQFIVPKCKHIFHRKCIAEWNKQSNECPNCRCDIVEKIPVSDFVYQFITERERIMEQERINDFNTYNRNRYNNFVLRTTRVLYIEEDIINSENEQEIYF